MARQASEITRRTRAYRAFVEAQAAHLKAADKYDAAVRRADLERDLNEIRVQNAKIVADDAKTAMEEAKKALDALEAKP